MMVRQVCVETTRYVAYVRVVRASVHLAHMYVIHEFGSRDLVF